MTLEYTAHAAHAVGAVLLSSYRVVRADAMVWSPARDERPSKGGRDAQGNSLGRVAHGSGRYTAGASRSSYGSVQGRCRVGARGRGADIDPYARRSRYEDDRPRESGRPVGDHEPRGRQPAHQDAPQGARPSLRRGRLTRNTGRPVRPDGVRVPGRFGDVLFHVESSVLTGLPR